MTTTLTLGKTVSFALTNVVTESEIVGISESLSLIRGKVNKLSLFYYLVKCEITICVSRDWASLI